MKKNILLPLVSFLFFLAADAQTQEVCFEDSCCEDKKNFYAKILGGANFLQNTEITENKSTYQTGYIIAGSLGYYWRFGLRLEAEYAFRRNAIRKIDFFVDESSKNGHYQAFAFMANLLWDLPLSSWGCTFWNIQPFIGAGIGYDLQKIHASNSRIVFNQKWNHFSWQLMAGVAYPVFCNTEIAMEYKFHQGDCHFCNHSLGIGLVYKFGFGKHCSETQ